MITNPSTNTGEIWHLGLDMTAQIPTAFGVPVFDSSGLTIPVNANDFKPFDQVLADRQPMLLPAGTRVLPFGQLVPNGWTGGLRRDGFGSFYSDDQVNNLHPGSSRGGFALISGGMPTIRKMQVKPYWEFISPGDATPQEEQAAINI